MHPVREVLAWAVVVHPVSQCIELSSKQLSINCGLFLVIISWSVACACRRTDVFAYDSRYLLVGGGIFLQKHSLACMRQKFQPRSLALVIMVLIIKKAHMKPLGVFYFGVSGSLTLAPSTPCPGSHGSKNTTRVLALVVFLGGLYPCLVHNMWVMLVFVVWYIYFQSGCRVCETTNQPRNHEQERRMALKIFKDLS